MQRISIRTAIEEKSAGGIRNGLGEAITGGSGDFQTKQKPEISFRAALDALLPSELETR